jgi:DNA topoisomerase-1
VTSDPTTARTLRRARLVYASDEQPGIRRLPGRHAFDYIGPTGRPIKNERRLKRFAALVIPPAWTDVWICPHPRGHIQATGRDARGRKQYIYHPDWREVRDLAKYDRLAAFAQALGALQKRLDRDLRRPGLSKRKVVATVIRLLQTTLIRVGNEEYAKQNGSFGMTTLRNRHVQIEGTRLRFQFRGKSGVEHAIDVRDRRLAKIVKACQELPGQILFAYVGDDEIVRAVKSEDVNAYLHAATGQDFTAKDFRTWAGTVLAAVTLSACEVGSSEAQIKRSLAAAVGSVAKKLGNTKTICRQCYVHPAIFEAYRTGQLVNFLDADSTRPVAKSLAHLTSAEAGVLALLRRAAL